MKILISLKNKNNNNNNKNTLEVLDFCYALFVDLF